MAEEWRKNAVYTYIDLLQSLKEKGIIIGIENMHMNKTEKPDDSRRFGYLPVELKKWRDKLSEKLDYDKFGFVLDMGHARNNMTYTSNYSLSKWFSALGKGIIAYHIHQTKEKKNHLPIEAVFGSEIAFGAFFCAWHRKQIAHSPVFIEVRGEENRNISYFTFREYVLSGFVPNGTTN